MKKSTIIIIAVIVCILALTGGIFLGIYIEKKEIQKQAEKEDFFKYEEVMEVTEEEIYAQLMDIQEFSTYMGEYIVEKTAEEASYIFDKIKIPLTTNKIELKCKGVVKVGYDFNEIDAAVDNDSKTIYISLPDAKINDNYIILDSIEITESNNILNPIEFAQYQELFKEIEAEGLEQVESEGIYDKAESNLKKIIDKTFAAFRDYKVEYIG